MAGLLTSSEQDMLGNIIQQRQQANQALGSGYGKYGGIVQAAAGMADTGADAIAGGGAGAADPRMQQMQAAKAIMTKVAKEVGSVTSATFYKRLSQELAAANFPEQAQKAADKANELESKEFESANRTRNVYRLIDSTDTWGNPIKKQVMVTQEWRNGKWVDMGEAVDDTNYSNEGRNAPPPPAKKTEGKRESRGTVEIGPAIQSEIAKTIPLPPLRPKEQGGGGLVGAEPEGMPPSDEKPMQFPKKNEVNQLMENRRFLLSERIRLKKQGKSTAQVEKALQANQAKLAEMQAKIERK